MINARTNEVLAAQIAIIAEHAQRLDTADLGRLQADLAEIERAVSTLKENLRYLPKE
jgi:hypothetical protein